jgi:hypothetical protein
MPLFLLANVFFTVPVPSGMISSMIDRITFDPLQCSGRPCIRGMRIRVKDVLDLLAAGIPQADHPVLLAR